MTLIKQEKLVFILVILYIQEYMYSVFMRFYKIVYGYPKISNFWYPVPEIPRKRTLQP